MEMHDVCSCIDDNNDDDQDVDGGDLVDRSVGQLSLGLQLSLVNTFSSASAKTF